MRSMEESMRIMACMDTDGDGTVDFGEFLAWWDNASFIDMFGSSAINR